jgi:hypothetical protein
MKTELPIPPIAKADPNAMEVVRVWVAKGGQHVSLNPFTWSDPEVWGMVLADLAGHLANAYHQEMGLDREETLRKISRLLVAELANPTDSPKGNIHQA